MGWLSELFGSGEGSHDDGDYSQAALDDLYRKISGRGWWPSARAEQQAEINRQRARALAMPDRKWRKAYLDWIEYFQKKLTEDIQQDADYARRKPEREAEERNRKEELERVRRLRETNPPDGSPTG
jgi:hypothetical protein